VAATTRDVRLSSQTALRVNIASVRSCCLSLGRLATPCYLFSPRLGSLKFWNTGDSLLIWFITNWKKKTVIQACKKKYGEFPWSSTLLAIASASHPYDPTNLPPSLKKHKNPLKQLTPSQSYFSDQLNLTPRPASQISSTHSISSSNPIKPLVALGEPDL